MAACKETHMRHLENWKKNTHTHKHIHERTHTQASMCQRMRMHTHIHACIRCFRQWFSPWPNRFSRVCDSCFWSFTSTSSHVTMQWSMLFEHKLRFFKSTLLFFFLDLATSNSASMASFWVFRLSMQLSKKSRACVLSQNTSMRNDAQFWARNSSTMVPNNTLRKNAQICSCKSILAGDGLLSHEKNRHFLLM